MAEQNNKKNGETEKPESYYKKWWFWLIFVMILVALTAIGWFGTDIFMMFKNKPQQSFAYYF
jgi:hypothetical protein